MPILEGGNVIDTNQAVVYKGAAAPVDGTSGTLANIALPGDLYVDTRASNIELYINTNTKASPTWVVVGTQT
jgi:hypothetical protein